MVRGSTLLFVTLVVGLAGCGKSGPDSTGTANAASNPAAKELKLAEASRKFLVIEPVGGVEPSGGRAYFGRVAFRPKALSAVTAPFAGRIASVLVEPGQRVHASTVLFTRRASRCAAQKKPSRARARWRSAASASSPSASMPR